MWRSWRTAFTTTALVSCAVFASYSTSLRSATIETASVAQTFLTPVARVNLAEKELQRASTVWSAASSVKNGYLEAVSGINSLKSDLAHLESVSTQVTQAESSLNRVAQSAREEAKRATIGIDGFLAFAHREVQLVNWALSRSPKALQDAAWDPQSLAEKNQLLKEAAITTSGIATTQAKLLPQVLDSCKNKLTLFDNAITQIEKRSHLVSVTRGEYAHRLEVLLLISDDSFREPAERANIFVDFPSEWPDVTSTIKEIPLKQLQSLKESIELLLTMAFSMNATELLDRRLQTALDESTDVTAQLFATSQLGASDYACAGIKDCKHILKLQSDLIDDALQAARQDRVKIDEEQGLFEEKIRGVESALHLVSTSSVDATRFANESAEQLTAASVKIAAAQDAIDAIVDHANKNLVAAQEELQAARLAAYGPPLSQPDEARQAAQYDEGVSQASAASKAVGYDTVMTLPKEHAYDFFTRAKPEPKGYGAYTYVLFGYVPCEQKIQIPQEIQLRYEKIVSAIAASTQDVEDALRLNKFKPSELNVFLVPVKKIPADRMPTVCSHEKKKQVDERYDGRLALSYLATAKGGAILRKEFLELLKAPGPYLLTTFVRLREMKPSSSAFLVDLTGTPDDEIPQILASYKEKVTTKAPLGQEIWTPDWGLTVIGWGIKGTEAAKRAKCAVSDLGLDAAAEKNIATASVMGGIIKTLLKGGCDKGKGKS